MNNIKNEMPSFTIIPNIVMDEFDLNPFEITVYQYLMRYKNCDEIFPSLTTIAKKSKMSIPTVRKALNGLVEKKLVSVEKKQYRGALEKSFYTLHDPFKIGSRGNDVSTSTKPIVKRQQPVSCNDVYANNKSINNKRNIKTKYEDQIPLSLVHEQSPVMAPDPLLHGDVASAPSEPDVPLVPKQTKGKSKPKNKPSQNIVAEWCSKHKARYGKNPLMYGPVLGTLARLEKEIEHEHLSQLINAYFENDDRWFVKKQHDVFTFEKNLQSLDVNDQTSEYDKMFCLYPGHKVGW